MKTAEDFLVEGQKNGWTTEKCLIEFAKMHVEKALKEVNKNKKVLIEQGYGRLDHRNPNEKSNLYEVKSFFGTTTFGHGDSSYYYVTVDSNTIFNSYPIENIK